MSAVFLGYPFSYFLYIIYARKFYVRAHVKITRQWKTTFHKDDVTRDDWQRRFLAHGYNIVQTLQHCAALKIVVVNRPV